MTNKLDLKWHTFNDHLLDNARHLLSSKQFADVTLVCDDNIHIKAHSFILSSCSSVFSNLFNGYCQTNAMVFLKGIDHRDLDQILQFMYNGKATFSEDRMDSFIATSKSLEVREISTGFEDKNEEAIHPSENNREFNSEFVPDNTFEENDIQGQYSVQNVSPIQPRVEQSKCVANPTRSNVCPDCERVFYDSSNMKKHYISKHQGVTFPCDQCDKVYTHQQQLTQHIKGVHEGLTIKCEYEDCDKEFNFIHAYRHHVKVRHKNISYSCSYCDFKTANKHYLNEHTNRKHEGIRFECNACGKQLSSKARLREHYRFNHEGISHKCTEENCNMKFSSKNNLSQHIKSKH